MKKVILIALVLAGLSSQAQKKDSTKVKPAIEVAIPDSLPSISVKDIQEFSTLIGNLPHVQYIKLTPEEILSNLVYWVRKKK